MRAAIRLLRSLLFSRALAFSVVPIGAFAPTPAAAYWQMGNAPPGDSPAQACENYALQPQDPFLFVDLQVIYFNGVPNPRCTFIYKLTGVPTYGYPGQVCPAGQVKNQFAANGCTVVAVPHTNNNGPPKCPQPSVGNPIAPLAGNKYEDVADLATAGPDALELRRFYNAFDGAQTTMFGRNWRSNFDRRIIETGGLRKLTRPDGVIVEFYTTSTYGNSIDQDYRLAVVGSTSPTETARSRSTPAPTESSLRSASATAIRRR